jgi:hypothetical protein
MEKELTAIAARTPSTLGGGNHGCAGIMVENAKITMMMGGVVFVNPVNPELYPAIAANVTAGTRAREEAVHKGLVQEYEIFCGVEAGLKEIILEAMENDYVLEIEEIFLAFQTKRHNKSLHTYTTEEANLTLPTQRNSSRKKSQNGTEVKSPKCTSTVLRKRCNNSKKLKLHQT